MPDGGGDSQRVGGIHFDVDVHGVSKVETEAARAGVAVKGLGGAMQETAAHAASTGSAIGGFGNAVHEATGPALKLRKAFRHIHHALMAIPFAAGVVVGAIGEVIELMRRLGEHSEESARQVRELRGAIFESLHDAGQFPEDKFDKELAGINKIAQAKAEEIAKDKAISAAQKEHLQEVTTAEYNAAQDRIAARRHEAEESAKHAGEGKAAVEAAQAAKAERERTRKEADEWVRSTEEVNRQIAAMWKEVDREHAENIKRDLEAAHKLLELAQKRTAEMQKFVDTQNQMFNGSQESYALSQIVDLMHQLDSGKKFGD